MSKSPVVIEVTRGPIVESRHEGIAAVVKADGTVVASWGDIDAAIPRFEDAIKLRSNFARPRLLLAECYEKKHEPSTAVKYLKEYLKVYPDAPDRKAVEKKIEKLSNK